MKFIKGADNKEVLTLTKTLSNDVDLLCKAVLDMFEKLGSKIASMENQMKSLEMKLEKLDVAEERRRGCCSICTIS